MRESIPFYPNWKTRSYSGRKKIRNNKVKRSCKIALKYVKHSFQGWSFAQLQFMDKVQSSKMLQCESGTGGGIFGISLLFFFSSVLLFSPINENKVHQSSFNIVLVNQNSEHRTKQWFNKPFREFWCLPKSEHHWPWPGVSRVFLFKLVW